MPSFLLGFLLASCTRAPAIAAPAPSPAPAATCGKPVAAPPGGTGPSAVLGDHLYWTDEQRFGEVLRVDARGRWEALPAPARERRFGRLVAVGGRVVLLGGVAPDPDPEDEVEPPPVRVVEAFDPATCRWQDLGALDHRGEAPATAAVDGAILLYGGTLREGGRFTPSTHVTAFDPASGRARALAPLPRLSQPVRDAVALGGRVYVFGDSNAVHVHDPTANSWSRAANHGGSGTAPLGTVVALGGRILQFPHTWGPIVPEAYDPATDRWTALAPLADLNDQQGDQLIAVGVLADALHAVAHRSRPGTSRTDLWRYDASRDAWVSLPASPSSSGH